MQIARIFTLMSYLSLAAGVLLSFWSMRLGATCMLLSIAFAHMASVLHLDKQEADMKETLEILLMLSRQAGDRLDRLRRHHHNQA